MYIDMGDIQKAWKAVSCNSVAAPDDLLPSNSVVPVEEVTMKAVTRGTKLPSRASQSLNMALRDSAVSSRRNMQTITILGTSSYPVMALFFRLHH
jgi:hypothetical protein